MDKPGLKNASMREAWSVKRKTIQPVIIGPERERFVRLSQLSAGQSLPVVVEPSLAGVNLAAWAGSNREFIESKLLKDGAILFRGFHINSHDELDQFLTSISLPRMHYMEGATPRTELKEKVYTSTEYPAEQSIALHNELNYVITWPMKIFFACAIPAREGGATPIADVRKVYDLIDPDIRARFIDKGWMLLRNFGEGLSLPWQTSFRMSSKSEFTSYCRESRITCEWKDENRVRTRQVRPAVRRHPKTAEPVWFNHIAFWHISSLAPEVREMFLKEFKEDDLPYNTYYGDGTPIEDSVVEHIREAYDRATIAFPWQRGDLLMIDNMLVAHGRKPFTGERKVLTAMGEPFSDKSSWNWSAAGFSGGSTL